MEKPKLKLTCYNDTVEDMRKITAEISMNRVVDDVYNKIVLGIADEIKEDVIDKVKSGMMQNKQLTKDLQEVIKRKLIEKLLPSDVISEESEWRTK